ncbi:hypothetical protein I203_104989 [Kwoniella mangroviensis CBS 8507]|uniref:uncharacterized protein n=1 Tax=Kwoniella mangroviensis CBS 8507 TaxID=1296122 RepID=UPI00080CE22C|nr:uncharacterized protein I203_00067 [Kwoniella mangroviensis CBS 8507]OCF69940.1 hypothetical protein I203_00067 [Kwoniella mangroviensis CBS 8507]
MRVFVTGATEFIGSYVVEEMQQEKRHEISGLARSDIAAKKLTKQGIKVVRGSLKDLDILHKAAKESDGVIHLGYVHDFVDENAIREMCSALEGTNKPFIGTSELLGVGGSGTTSLETDRAATFRQNAEDLLHSFANKGVRTVVIRASPIVHGNGDHMLLPLLIDKAKQKGYAGYLGEGSNHWTGVHVKDLAVLYRLTLEKENVKGGSTLHGVDRDDEGITMKELATSISKHLNIPLKSLNDEEGQGVLWVAVLVYDSGF